MSSGELCAASEADKVRRDRVTLEAWGSPLDLSQWLERERLLRAHPWCRDHMETWLWREGDTVVASCETFRMLGHLRGGPGRPVFGVASVFVERALRGRGYAERMMRALLAQLRAREPDALASILYSDVGAPLYVRAGYTAPVPQPVDWFFPADVTAAPADPLREEDVEVALKGFPVPRGELVVWPTAPQLDWHWERARFYARVLGRARPTAAGAVVAQGRVLWTGDLRHGELAVLLLHAETADTGRALVAAAQRAAAEAGLSGVRLWDEPPFVAGQFAMPRDGSLPMSAPLAPEAAGAVWAPALRALWI